MLLFPGTSHPDLAHAIANSLATNLGRCTCQRFPDGEVAVVIEEEVRGQEVFLLQSTCPPVDNHLMELLALADACRRADAARITAVIPYFGYGRADHRHGESRAVMASVVARLLESVGITRVITFDLHVSQMEGFFHIPVATLTATPLLLKGISDYVSKDTVVVSPDAGRLKLAFHYADQLNTDVAVLHKQRHSGKETQMHRLVGDVKGRSCLIVDDLIATGSTLKEAIAALLEAGAAPEITVAATHTLACATAAEVLGQGVIKHFITTDTVPQTLDLPHLKVVSVASRIANAIERILAGQSLESLY